MMKFASVVCVELSSHANTHRLYLLDNDTREVIRVIVLTKMSDGVYQATLDSAMDTGKNLIGYVRASNPQAIGAKVMPTWYADRPEFHGEQRVGIRAATEDLAAWWYQSHVTMTLDVEAKTKDKN